MVSPRYIRPAEIGKPYGFAYRADRKNTLRPVEVVEFDVAVVAVEGAEKKGGIGIMVGSVGIGGQATTERSSTSHSRLKFQVPIVLPSAGE